MIAELVAAACCLLAMGGCGYYVLSLFAIAEFLAAPEEQGGDAEWPAVSILKPVKGMDPDLYESFRSHCLQDYEHYEIVFGVCDLEDAAVPAIRRLQEEFPQKDVRLVVCPEASATNRKVGNLAQMLRQAKYSAFVVNDSDIRVGREYLRHVVAGLRDAKVGLVTALYRAVPERSLWSRLEALGISTDFVPGVLSARKLEGGIRFGLGSTLAFRREALEAIGGFEPLFDRLGDDYELGARIARAGYEVRLAHEVVETFLPDYSLRGFIDHQLRWARVIRDSRPKDYLAMGITYAVPWALACVLFAGARWWSVLLLLVTLTLRMTVAWRASQSVLADAAARRDLWMVPLRDVVAVAIWVTSFFGNTVVWRGERFRLHRGTLVRG